MPLPATRCLGKLQTVLACTHCSCARPAGEPKVARVADEAQLAKAREEAEARRKAREQAAGAGDKDESAAAVVQVEMAQVGMHMQMSTNWRCADAVCCSLQLVGYSASCKPASPCCAS